MTGIAKAPPEGGAFAIKNVSKLQTVLLVELVNASAGIDELLLAGVEGVALGANFDGDVGLSAAGLDDGAAGAANGGLLIVGVYSGLHRYLSP